MKSAILFATAVIAAASLPAVARADIYCPHQISIFGTVQGVNDRERVFTLLAQRSDLGNIHVTFDPTRVDAHGLALQRGVFAGVYGCLTAGARSFTAEEVTLANNANDYNGYPRRTVSFDGRITSVASGRFLLESDDGHGNVWVYTNQQARTGEHVRVTGTFDPTDSAFVASSVSPL